MVDDDKMVDQPTDKAIEFVIENKFDSYDDFVESVVQSGTDVSRKELLNIKEGEIVDKVRKSLKSWIRDRNICWRKHMVEKDENLVIAGKLIAKGESGFRCAICGRKYNSGEGWNPGR